MKKLKNNLKQNSMEKMEKKQEIHSKEEADEILRNIENAKYIVKEVKKKVRKKEMQLHLLQQVQCNKRLQEN